MSDDITPPGGGEEVEEEAQVRSIKTISLTDEMSASYMDYAMSTIVSRALPDVRDGLKPVQRRILQAMADLNLRHNRPTLKCAKICGQTSGDYHPHGEQNVYPAMVRLGQDFSLRYMLVDGQGNYGSVDGDPPAAMRYTEARMSAIAEAMLEDIEFDTVDFKPNYDERVQEPTVLPGRFPNLLCNGNEGIAVGMACKLPPHNLREVCEGICAYIENPALTVEELMEYIPGPDFPTHGMILGTAGIRDAYTTGRGSITMQGRAAPEPIEGNRTALVITELPYQVNKARFQEKVADLVRNGKLTDISAIRDESDRNGMRVVIELKRDAVWEVVLNQLYKRTDLRVNFPVMNIALVKGRPVTLTLLELVKYFVEHREQVVTRRTRFLLKQAEDRAHLLEGMLKALDIIDQIINTIRTSAHRTEARQRLQDEYEFSARQAQAIVEMTLGQLTGLERQKLQDEYDELQETIAYYRELLADKAKRLAVVRDETKEISDKFGDDRRTQMRKGEAKDLRVEDLIAEEDMCITITRDGYAKRIPIATYRVQRRGGRGLLALTKKEEDAVEHMFVATTHHFILFFTNRGRVHQLRAFEIPQAGRQARGTPVINLINIEPGEYVTATIPISGLDVGGYLTMVTRQGTIKRTEMSDFRNINRMGLIAIGLVDDDELLYVLWTEQNDQLVIATQQGMSIRFDSEDVRSMGRAAQGVRGIKLRNKDVVAGVVKLEEGQDLFVCGTRGLGKRTPVVDEDGEDIYRLQSRGGIGIITYKVTARTGEVVGMIAVDDDDELMLLTENGVLIRIPCKKISQTGRSAMGVKLINLDDGDAVANVTKVVRMDEPADGPRASLFDDDDEDVEDDELEIEGDGDDDQDGSVQASLFDDQDE